MNIVQQVQTAQGQAPEQQDPEAEIASAELEKIRAEAEKIRADIELVKEKIVSERVDQEVKAAGVQYDQEELKIRRAELMKEFMTSQKEEDGDGAKGKGSDKTPAAKQKSGYSEKGLKSNNKEGGA
jgi:hypothetical protein